MSQATLSHSAGMVYDLPPEGLILWVTLPDDFPGIAGEPELPEGEDGAALWLQAPSDTYLLDQILWTSEIGAGLPAVPVRWLCADLTRKLPLCAATVTTDAGVRVRIKAAQDGEAWLPVTGADGSGKFPQVLARKVLIELGNDKGEPVAAKVTIALQAAYQPREVSVAVGDAPPFFQHAGLLPLDQPVVVTGLATALNKYLRSKGSDPRAPIALKVRAQVPGQIRLSRFAVTSHTVCTVPGGKAALSVPWEAPAVATVALGDSAALKEVRFAVQADLLPQRTALAPDSPLVGTQRQSAALCSAEGALAPGSTEHAAAQRFAAPAAALICVGLQLRALGASFAGTVAVHADQAGQPRGAPLLQLPLALADPASRWVSLPLPAPLALSAPFWLVLSAAQGAALWYLDEQPPRAAVGSSATRAWRLGKGAWVQKPGFARSRLHIQSQSTPSPVVRLRRGSSQVPAPEAGSGLELDAQGQACLSESQLAALNQELGQPLELIASAASAGTVTLSNLRVRADKAPMKSS